MFGVNSVLGQNRIRGGPLVTLESSYDRVWYTMENVKTWLSHMLNRMEWVGYWNRRPLIEVIEKPPQSPNAVAPEVEVHSVNECMRDDQEIMKNLEQSLSAVQSYGNLLRNCGLWQPEDASCSFVLQERCRHCEC